MSTALLFLFAFLSVNALQAGMQKKKLHGKVNERFSHQATPAVSADGRQLYYMYKNPRDKSAGQKDNWDIYVSTLGKDGWSAGKKISAICGDYFEGYPSITADGRYLFFVANSKRKLENGKLTQDLDIYYSFKKNSQWQKPRRLPEGVNFKDSDESGASISPDGTRLVYFSEVGVDNAGGFDIYIVERNEKNEWTLSKNIGSPINTKYNETAPYLAPDGRTIYFSSDRPGGSGGYDLYKSEYKNGRWGRPENLGSGVNTAGSDLGLSIAGNGEQIFLSGQDKYNTWHLYQSTLPPKAQPKKILLVNARAVNSRTGKPVEATLVLEDLDSGKYLGSFKTEAHNGRTTLSLVEGRRYSVSITASGYLFYTDNFDLKKHSKYREEEQVYKLAPLEVGQSIILKNIFFNPGSANLSRLSRLALDRLAGVLKKHNSLQLEIGGHTDDRGPKKMNQKLSERRARSVYNYLVKSSVPESRLKVKGYGSDKPVASNKTEAGRQKNRRTEFKILKK